MSSSTLRKHTAGTRRLARELALRLLYQVDIAQMPLDECFAFAVEHMPIDEEGQRFAYELASGTLQNLQKIDSIIARFAIGWPPERQPAPDRNHPVWSLVRQWSWRRSITPTNLANSSTVFWRAC
jgi:transcription termination factor NusB